MNPLDPKDILIEQAHNPELIFRLRPKNEASVTKLLSIDPGSGIVGRIVALDDKAPYVSIYYESNRYNAVNLKTLEEKEKCAAGRLHAQYPTVARTSLSFDEAISAFDFEIPQVSLVPKIAERPQRHPQGRHRLPHDERGWQPN